MPPRETTPLEREALIDAIYTAAFASDPSWREVFRALADYAGVVACGVKIEWPRLGGMTQTWFGLEPEFERDFVAEYWREDPWTKGSRGYRPGRFLLPAETIANDALVRTRFYQELCKPFGLHDAMGTVLSADDNHYATFGLMRPRGARGDGTVEAARMRPFVPHLRRAVRLRFSALAEPVPPAATAASDALEAVPFPTLVTDAEGQIRATNGAADALLRAADVLLATPSGLTARRRDDAERLRQAIAATATTGDGAELCLRREDAFAVLGVVVRPARSLPGEASAPDERPRHRWPPSRATDRRLVIVHAIDPRLRATPQARLLATLFALSPAEVRLALALAKGMTPQDCAARFKVAMPTVRSQLAALFRKTNTSRQAELVSMLARLALSV